MIVDQQCKAWRSEAFVIFSLSGKMASRHFQLFSMNALTRLAIVAAFLLLLFAGFEFSGLRSHLTLAYIQQTITAHWLSGLLIFILLFSLGNLIQVPGLVFLGAAVLALGKLWGGVATYLAAMSSCLITFLTIGLLGGSALRELKSPFAAKILARLDQRPIASVALLRLLFQTAPALNYALALSGLRLRHYLLGTALGLPLPIALYCIFFDYLRQALQAS
jgi:uncharacterized membrane protein YdjX (TVP38/TMEM64 family)